MPFSLCGRGSERRLLDLWSAFDPKQTKLVQSKFIQYRTCLGLFDPSRTADFADIFSVPAPAKPTLVVPSKSGERARFSQPVTLRECHFIQLASKRNLSAHYSLTLFGSAMRNNLAIRVQNGGISLKVSVIF